MLVSRMTTVTKTTIALIQMRCGPEPEKNLARAIEFVRQAAEDAQIVCLPELFRSQYFCQTEDHKNFDLAEEVPGKSTAALGDVARETGTVIIASLFEKRSAGVYHNSAAIIDTDGKLLGKYRKMHIPDDPLYHEKFYFAPGDLGFQAWQTTHGKIGVCVCWDQWYPEAARLTALRPSLGPDVRALAERAVAARRGAADELPPGARGDLRGLLDSLALAALDVAERVGHEAPAGGDGIEFWGQSFVCGPDGEIVAKASVEREEILLADIDWNRVTVHRIHWPFLRDRRVDAYSGLDRRMID